MTTRREAQDLKLAEAKARGDSGAPALNEKVAQKEKEARKLFDLVEMQKTAPAVRGGGPIWHGPNKLYVATAARAQAIEDELATR